MADPLLDTHDIAVLHKCVRYFELEGGMEAQEADALVDKLLEGRYGLDRFRSTE